MCVWIPSSYRIASCVRNTAYLRRVLLMRTCTLSFNMYLPRYNTLYRPVIRAHFRFEKVIERQPCQNFDLRDLTMTFDLRLLAAKFENNLIVSKDKFRHFANTSYLAVARVRNSKWSYYASTFKSYLWRGAQVIDHLLFKFDKK